MTKWNWRIPRAPDFLIGPDKSRPYLRRWWVIPRNKYFNIYLHHILHDDEDRALHDHPWWNVSIILKGGYLEWQSVPGASVNCVWRGRGAVVFRRAVQAHRLTLGYSSAHQQSACWSLFITGPVVRTWGFHCSQGWRPWHEFVDPNDPGKPGRGCD